MLFVLTVVGRPIAEFQAESASSQSHKLDVPQGYITGFTVVLSVGGFIELPTKRFF